MQKKNLINIDGDFLLYYATMGNKVLDEFGVPLKQDNKFVYTEKLVEEVYETIDSIINNIINIGNGDCYVGYLGNSKSFRYNIDPLYKANREGLVKPKWFKEAKDYLVDRWKFELLNNGLEADDAVNIVRNRLKNDYNIFTVTTDKDLIKCIPGKYINARDCSIIRTSKEKGAEAFWTSMIVGDGVDNIKGIKGCGKKFAEKLFRETSLSYEEAVITAYKDKYKDNWMEEYNKNYQLLYILDDYEGFEISLNQLKEVAVESSRESSSKDW